MRTLMNCFKMVVRSGSGEAKSKRGNILPHTMSCLTPNSCNIFHKQWSASRTSLRFNMTLCFVAPHLRSLDSASTVLRWPFLVQLDLPLRLPQRDHCFKTIVFMTDVFNKSRRLAAPDVLSATGCSLAWTRQAALFKRPTLWVWETQYVTIRATHTIMSG